MQLSCPQSITSSLACLGKSNGMVVISTLCHYVSSYICVLSAQLDSKLTEERAFLSCHPCVTNSNLIQSPVLDVQRGTCLVNINKWEIQSLTSWLSFNSSKLKILLLKGKACFCSRRISHHSMKDPIAFKIYVVAQLPQNAR